MARAKRKFRGRSGRGARKQPEREMFSFDGVVTTIGARGDGVIESPTGPFFAPLTAPGDVGAFEAAGKRARLVRLDTPGPDRIDAPCIHYGDCGGCSLQHVSKQFYLDWKRARVGEALTRAGLEAPLAPVVETPVASRRRATFAVRKIRGALTFGFNERRGERIISISDCLILCAEIKTALPMLERMCAQIDAPTFDLSVTLCSNGLDLDFQGMSVEALHRAMTPDFMDLALAANVIRFSADGETALTRDPPMIDIAGFHVTPPSGGFLQASAEGQAALLDLVTTAAGKARQIADLFCGAGAFALPLSRTATVYAADADPRAIEAMRRAHAAAQASGEPIRPLTAEIRNLFDRPVPTADLNRFDVVVFDPPRAGALEQARELAASEVRRVIAVSCNPDTFARDAAVLVAGGHKLSRVTPVDQFVYSAHVELVAVFDKD